MVVSQRKFAQLAQVSPKAVRKAVTAGRLVAIAGSTGLDPADPRNAAFLATHTGGGAAPASRESPARSQSVVEAERSTSSTLAGLNATLHGRLYDLALWEANTVSAERVRVELHDDCDYWLKVANALPAEAGCHIALVLAVPPGELVAQFDAAMADFLKRAGDQHARVDALIEKVQRQWIDYPIRRVAKPPAIPDFIALVTEAEARARLAEARGELNRIRMQFRAGNLLAAEAARFAADDLRTRWTMMLADEFPAAYCASLMPATRNLMWALDQTIGYIAIGRLSSYWSLGLARGNFPEAMGEFAAERWRRHGGYPTKEEVPALQAADQRRVEEAQRLRRERLQ